ncbi:MAG: AAA family ATPase [Candidatus Altiarchaeota archaeon]|nr:AAA family ATPase [Candidatus Altiarchaeota archaeon]
MESKSIAVTGKGGVGKTLVAGLLVKFLGELTSKTVLAIDADPDSNLAECLGVTFDKTVGDLRVGLLDHRLAPGMDKKKYLDAKVFEITVETEKFDLLVMGRPDGPGCYCAINHMIKGIMDSTTEAYDCVVVDSEAGLEHLSRKTIENIDSLMIVTDASRKGLLTAKRISELVNELDMKFRNISLVLNKVTEANREELIKKAREINLEIIGVIPEDPLVEEYDLKGKPLVELPSNSKAYQEIKKIADTLK